MNVLTEITNDPKQEFQVQLEDNTFFTLNLEFITQQEQWIMNISDIPNSTLVINGLRIASMPNILRQWNRIIPFGIYVVTANNDDPFSVEDFKLNENTGLARAAMVILNQTEVQEIEALINGG